MKIKKTHSLILLIILILIGVLEIRKLLNLMS
nr:MAG TPA: hypothetical protein [Caudoviricetes sp.]